MVSLSVCLSAKDERVGKVGNVGQSSLCQERTPHGGVAKPAGSVRRVLRSFPRHQVVQRPLRHELPGPEVSAAVTGVDRMFFFVFCG